MMENLTLIGLPLATRAMNMGMASGVRALRDAGLTKSLSKNSKLLRDSGDITLSNIREDSGPKNLTNFPQYAQDTESIRSALAGLEPDGMIFGVGGECSICVGTVAGLKEKIGGKPGIVWIDAHGDFNTPETTPSGFIGGMCLAFACGRGPKLEFLPKTEPLLNEKNVVHVGSRALDREESANMSRSGMTILSMSTLRMGGFESALNKALSSLASRCDWIICHLDVDSIEPTVVTAVNFPESGGLSLKETQTIVRTIEDTKKLKLFELAGYNSDLDSDRSCARKLVGFVSDILRH